MSYSSDILLQLHASHSQMKLKLRNSHGSEGLHQAVGGGKEEEVKICPRGGKEEEEEGLRVGLCVHVELCVAKSTMGTERAGRYFL